MTVEEFYLPKFPDGFENLTDEELVELSHNGDTVADEVLCARYKNLVRIKSRPYFLIGGDKEDLLQEGMIGLYKAVRDFAPGHDMSFRSFAELCIVRQIITAIKQATRKKHTPLNNYISIFKSVENEGERTLIDTMATTHTQSPEEMFIDHENMTGTLRMLRDMLSPLEKDVLEQFVQGHSYQEIAAQLGRSTKTVDNALQRIKKKIEVHLKNRCQ